MPALIRRLVHGLALAGRHGPFLLAGGVVIGLLFPRAAEALRPYRDIAVFGFTFAAFLRADWQAISKEIRRPARYLLITVVAMAVIPLGIVLAAQALGMDGLALQAVVISVLAPPAGSSAALAMMVGLDVPTVIVASLITTVAAPLVLPLASPVLAGAQLDLDPGLMALRLVAVVGGAALLAALVRRVWKPEPKVGLELAIGVSVVSLLVFAIGAMTGIGEVLQDNPHYFVLLIAVAYAVNIGQQLVGALLFQRLGHHVALSTGLCFGFRNTGLVWAALGPMSTPAIDIYMAAVLFPFYTLPVVMKPVIRFVLARAQGLSAEAA